MVGSRREWSARLRRSQNAPATAPRARKRRRASLDSLSRHACVSSAIHSARQSSRDERGTMRDSVRMIVTPGGIPPRVSVMSATEHCLARACRPVRGGGRGGGEGLGGRGRGFGGGGGE